MAELNVGYTSLADAPEREVPEPFQGKGVKMQLIEADVAPTKDGTGRRLTYKAEVIEGEFKGRKVFGGINIINKSPEAQKIGQAELAELVAAIKLPSIPGDTGELLYRPFSADVKIAPARTDTATGKSYDARSEIARWKLYDGAEARPKSGAATGSTGGGSANPGAAGSAPSSTNGAGRRPWEN